MWFPWPAEEPAKHTRPDQNHPDDGQDQAVSHKLHEIINISSIKYKICKSFLFSFNVLFALAIAISIANATAVECSAAHLSILFRKLSYFRSSKLPNSVDYVISAYYTLLVFYSKRLTLLLKIKTELYKKRENK